MDMQQLQPYPLMTRLSAAVHAGDMSLAEMVLADAMTCYHDPGVIESIRRGRRLARPVASPSPYKDGETNLDDCIREYGRWSGNEPLKKGKTK